MYLVDNFSLLGFCEEPEFVLSNGFSVNCGGWVTGKQNQTARGTQECNDVTGVITALPTVTVTLTTLVQAGASHWSPGHEEGL